MKHITYTRNWSYSIHGFIYLSVRLHTLSALSHYIHCAYSPLSGAAVLMKDVTKVLLGASCLVSDAYHQMDGWVFGSTSSNFCTALYMCSYRMVPCWLLLVLPWWRLWLKLDRWVMYIWMYVRTYAIAHAATHNKTYLYLCLINVTTTWPIYTGSCTGSRGELQVQW